MTSLVGMKEFDVVAHVRRCVRRFDGYASRWRGEAKDAYEFLVGRQWPSEDLAYLQEQNRPVVTFNRVDKFVEAIVGTEINNKMEWKYLVGGIEDTAATDLTSKVVRQLTIADTEAETTEAFRDMLVCGYGWTDTRLDYTVSMSGKIAHERVDPLHAGWDPRARKRNLSDARWVFRIKDYDADELEEEIPGSLDKVRGSGIGVLSEEESPGVLMEEQEYNFDVGSLDDPEQSTSAERYRVVCFQQAAIKEMIVAVNPITGMTESIEKDKFEALKKHFAEIGQPEPTSAIRKQRVWHHVYVCGTSLLKEAVEVPCRTLEVMTGKFDRNNKHYYGIVRSARDPQCWENKFMSTMMHNMSSQGKGLLVEEDAIPPNEWRNFERDFARPDKIKKLASGGIDKIKAPDAVPLPAGLGELMNRAAAAVPDILGLSPEFLGLAGRTQSGVVERSRRQAGLAVLAGFFQSRREHIKRTGCIQLSFVLKYMPDNIFIRIGGQEAMQILPQLRAAGFEDYDVQVDEAAVSPDQKAEVWQDVMQLAPVLIPMGLPAAWWLAALRYSPWPASLVDQLAQAMSQPNPQAEQAAQLDLAQKGADVQETHSKIMLNRAKAQEAVTPDMTNVLSAQAEHQKNLAEAGMKQQEHGMKMQQLAASTGAAISSSRVKQQTDLIKGFLELEKSRMALEAQKNGG